MSSFSSKHQSKSEKQVPSESWNFFAPSTTRKTCALYGLPKIFKQEIPLPSFLYILLLDKKHPGSIISPLIGKTVTRWDISTQVLSIDVKSLFTCASKMSHKDFIPNARE